MYLHMYICICIYIHIHMKRETDKTETLSCLAGSIYCSLIKVEFFTPTGFIRYMYNTFCDAGNQTQGLLHAGQVPYH